MPVAKLSITAKGQITLKRALLDHLGLKPGDKLEADFAPGRTIELKPADDRPDISAVFGMLHDPDRPPMSIEDMDQAIMDFVAADDLRIKRGE